MMLMVKSLGVVRIAVTYS